MLAIPRCPKGAHRPALCETHNKDNDSDDGDEGLRHPHDALKTPAGKDAHVEEADGHFGEAKHEVVERLVDEKYDEATIDLPE